MIGATIMTQFETRPRGRLKHLVRACVVPACAAFCVAAAPLDLPARKIGLWEIKIAFESPNPILRRQQPSGIHECIDAETDKQMHPLSMGMAKAVCSKVDVHNVPDKIVVDRVCTFGAEITTSHAEITGNFDTAFIAKVTTKSNDGPELRMSIEAEWKGSCPDHLKPGEMITATGKKMHIREMQPAPGVTSPPR
jgi:hypothetical protein